VYTLLVLAVLAQPGAKPAAPGAEAPTQMLAGIDSKGTLRLTFATSMGCFGSSPYMPAPVVPVAPGAAPGKAPAQARPKVKVTTVMVTTAELAAKHVQAYTAGGRTIPAEKLAALLAKERPVLVALDGKKVDPFMLQLYKEDTIILVPPENTLNTGLGGFGGPVVLPAPYGAFPEKMMPGPAPVPLDKPLPEELKKRLP
jgi:hypothetical protein